MALRNWNPREPYVLGLEWAGMRQIAAPLSQDVEYGHTFQSNAGEAINSAAFEIIEPSVTPYTRDTALITVYDKGNETKYGQVRSTMCPVNGGSVTSTASLQNAATVAEALATPSDFKYILIPGGNARLEFATSGLFTGKRILEVKLHFSAKATVLAEPDAKATLDVTYSGTSHLSDLILIDGAAPGAGVPSPSNIRILSLGEINYGGGLLPKSWPWTPADVDLFDSSTNIKFGHLGGSDYGLDYAVLEVVWCEENREAVGALLLGAEEEPAAPGQHIVDLRLPDGTDNWVKNLDETYTITLTSARSAGFGWVAQGGPPMIPLLDGFDVFDQHEGRVAPRRRTNVLASADANSRICPIRLTTTTGLTPSDFAPYDNVLDAGVYATWGPQHQGIQQRSGGSAVVYPWIRFYARELGDGIAFDISHPAGTMNLFSAALAALPEIYNGWREVTLRWPAGQEPTMSNAGTVKTFTFDTTQGDAANRFEILGASSLGLMNGFNGNPTYGLGTGAAEYDHNGNANPFMDLVVTVHTDAPAVSGLAVTVNTLALPDVSTFCGLPEPCVPASYERARLAWTATTLTAAEFDYYEIQRREPSFGDVWETVAKLVARTQNVWYDEEVRTTDVTSYRIRLCRADRICGAWSSTVNYTPVAAYGVGTLLFSSNVGMMRVAYREVFQGSVEEPFDFVEAASVAQQRMFGRFGTQSFHGTERGGVRFERTLLVNALAVPDTEHQTAGTMDEAFRALRDLAWADVPYVCVRDELGNRWYATVVVPSAVIRRSKQIHLAQVQIIESTNVPFPAAA